MSLSRSAPAAIVALVAIVAALPTASAHSREYYNYDDCDTKDPLLLLQGDCLIWECFNEPSGFGCQFNPPCFWQDEFDYWSGRVCFPSWDLVPNAAGQATLGINDDLANPMAGFVCQDSDFDGVCGESGELGDGFCGSVSISEPDWQTWYPVWVFIGGPIQNTKECGVPAWGTHGFVYH